jgi:hypothetical protein
MGKQRYQSNKIVLFFTYFLLISMLFVSGCSKKNQGKNNQMILDNWVKKEVLANGAPKYPMDAKVSISAPLNVTIPDVEAYRGTITSKEKQWDGIFFINNKNQSVEFLDVANQKTGDK